MSLVIPIEVARGLIPEQVGVGVNGDHRLYAEAGNGVGRRLHDLEQPRNPHAVTRVFTVRARKLGFRLRFHDLRGSHGSNLIRHGLAPDLVARRLGHDPATMLRSYIKPITGDEASTHEAIAAMSLGGGST